MLTVQRSIRFSEPVSRREELRVRRPPEPGAELGWGPNTTATSQHSNLGHTTCKVVKLHLRKFCLYEKDLPGIFVASDLLLSDLSCCSCSGDLLIATSANLWTRIFSSLDLWTSISISRHLLSLHHSPLQHCSSIFSSLFRSTNFLFLLGLSIIILPLLRPCARPTATSGPSSESSSVSAAADASIRLLLHLRSRLQLLVLL